MSKLLETKFNFCSGMVVISDKSRKCCKLFNFVAKSVKNFNELFTFWSLRKFKDIIPLYQSFKASN